MRRTFLTCAGAVVALALTAPSTAHAQFSLAIGNPYTGSGVFIGNGYGYPGYGYGGVSNYYSSGYYGLGAPAVGVTPYAPAVGYSSFYGSGYGYGYPGYRYGYPAGVYRRGYYGVPYRGGYRGYGYRAPYGLRRGWGRW